MAKTRKQKRAKRRERRAKRAKLIAEKVRNRLLGCTNVCKIIPLSDLDSKFARDLEWYESVLTQSMGIDPGLLSISDILKSNSKVRVVQNYTDQQVSPKSAHGQGDGAP